MYGNSIDSGHLTFPPGFVLGAATAAYQIEGRKGGRTRAVHLGHLQPHPGEDRPRCDW